MSDEPTDASVEDCDSDAQSSPSSDTVPGDTAADPPDIFISYRVRPDEDLAGALKAMLESAIDPTPRVFVSGLGGLRASAQGYREQLRHAASKARLYVGLITKSSVDREWIFFEAGAAFGRGVLYAPLLVDVAPSDLPSSIGGYQATAGNDISGMQELVADVARELGFSMKSHFARRCSRFTRAVESYGRTQDLKELSGISKAVQLLEEGLKDEATQLFRELIAEATTQEEAADIRISQLFFTNLENDNLLELLEKEPESIRETATCKLWLGVSETNPVRAVELLRAAAPGLTQPFSQRWALSSLVRNEFELGHEQPAFARLVDGLRSADRQYRATAAGLLAERLDGPAGDIGKLLLRVEATIGGDLDALDALARYCWDKEYAALGLHVADDWVKRAKASGSSSHLYRGLLRSQANLVSLAYADYKVAGAGSAVAKCNMASALNRDGVAQAGLDVLTEHEGRFDAADPGFPYEVRASLERSVDEERKKQKELLEFGARLKKMIHRIAEGWRRRTIVLEERAKGRWKAIGKTVELSLSFDGTKWDAALDESPLEVVGIDHLSSLYVLRESGAFRGFVSGGEDLEVVFASGLSEPGKLEWLDVEPLQYVEPHDSPEESP